MYPRVQARYTIGLQSTGLRWYCTGEATIKSGWGIMAKNHTQVDEPLSPRERRMYRIVFGVFGFFVVYGLYLLFFPTDLLTDIFAVLLLVTLGVGMIGGLIAVASSR